MTTKSLKRLQGDRNHCITGSLNDGARIDWHLVKLPVMNVFMTSMFSSLLPWSCADQLSLVIAREKYERILKSVTLISPLLAYPGTPPVSWACAWCRTWCRGPGRRSTGCQCSCRKCPGTSWSFEKKPWIWKELKEFTCFNFLNHYSPSCSILNHPLASWTTWCRSSRDLRRPN